MAPAVEVAPVDVLPVDVLLVFAIDASGSLSDAHLTLQREGHAGAVGSAAFVAAVRSMPRRRVALTVVEWSDHDRQEQVVPWTIIAGRDTAEAFAAALLRAPRPMPGFTSISGAIDFSAGLLKHAPFAAARRVIDVSGNGANNDGRPAAEARDDAVAAGITVNGLPILDVDAELDTYYANDVIGGDRAFLTVARDLASFSEAALRKLVTEIATAAPGLPLSGGSWNPARFAPSRPAPGR